MLVTVKRAIFLTLLAGCTASSSAPADLGTGESPSDGGADGATSSSAGGTYLLTLDAGAFPPSAAHPSALVYVPRNFDPTPPVAVVVYLHGFSNCVENVVRDAGGECTPGGGPRAAYALAAQLEASGKNAILLCPEVVFDARAGNPGNLGNPDGFKALLAEVLADLSDKLGGAGIGDVGTVVVASHSGGYQAAAAVANTGGVPVAELYLLDSLYGNTADFDTWAKAPGPGRRFADVYTNGGGTLANSQAMADRARAWVPAAQLLDDRTTATLTDAEYAHQLIFKLSALAHDGVPAYYFGKLVGSSVLAPKK
ncbi:MAG: hypothetical protein JWN44_5448 [Myxococcales bacterium]|nr:hypothetical protein [Myxococcales bacterium]